MEPERWRQVDELFQSALERHPAERAGFLNEVCSGDPLLRQQVEALLAGYEKAGDFIETPAFEAAARQLAADRVQAYARLTPGHKLGHYRIIDYIGAGGMGEVYLAQDLKLERKVALKILLAEFAANQDGMARFVQEAKAASALTHPNIITVHEIDQADSTHFIAIEFIQGGTLRKCMQGGMKIGEVLDVAVQVASALAAAHAAGIIHRDIKPENVMVTHDGIVKVLDFGVAKLTERPSPGWVDSEAPTHGVMNTDPGTAVGTVAYMSPEQARGLQVDGRTDVFSLGVLIYEMVAGRLPLEGSNTNEIVASILSDRELPPLTRYAREVPAEFERIVEKALRKAREQRYQSAKDLLLDLRSLQNRLQFEAELERSRPDRPDSGVATLTSAGTSTTPAESTNHRLIATIALALLVVVVAGFAYFVYFNSTRTAGAIDSIAVLPLANATNDPNLEYLSDGISETLINSLTELGRLRVLARATAFRYKGKEVDPQQVGRELNVRAVLTGRVREMGDTLNIQVDLVDAATGAQLWGREYESKVSDALSVKQAIAREVSAKLRLKLSGEDERRLVKRDTTNGEAYQFYLRGRYFLNKRTAEGLKKAIVEFQQALDRDPNYALGYVGLADSYGLLEEYTGAPAIETLRNAKAAVDRALQIDDSLAEAHTSTAFILDQMWRWPESEAQFRRAIALNPNYATAHHWFSIHFRAVGQLDNSLSEIKRAQELDPLSPVIGQNVVEVYLLQGDLKSAIEQSQKIIELDPSFPGAHDELGFAYLKESRNQEAIAEFQKAVESSGTASRYQGDLGYSYAVSGRRAAALAIAKELEEKYFRREAIGQYVAQVYAGLGDREHAFAWLEKDFQQRSGRMEFVKWWFTFDDLRGDPRYLSLLGRMGLTP